MSIIAARAQELAAVFTNAQDLAGSLEMGNERERQFKCTAEGCGAVVTTELPEGTVVNKPTFSMLVLTHQEPSLCPNCGQGYVFILRGIKGMEMGWMPVVVQKTEDSGIIIPPTSLIDMSK